MKSILTINQAIMENTECSIIQVYTLFINLKVGVLLNTTLRFAYSSSNMLGNIPSEE